MKKYKNLEKYTIDDLIRIAYIESKEWQPDAIKYAKHLLKLADVTDQIVIKRIPELKNEPRLLWQSELLSRPQESFSVLEMADIFLFWYLEAFKYWHWRLGQQGFRLKRRQRLITISYGIAFYVCLILYINYDYNKKNEALKEEIAAPATIDSIVLQSNWSGKYYFADVASNASDSLIWELSLTKISLEYKGNLVCYNSQRTLVIECLGLMKNTKLVLLPNNNTKAWDGSQIGVYDKLLTLDRIDSQITTNWGILKPHYDYKDGIAGFRQIEPKSAVGIK